MRARDIKPGMPVLLGSRYLPNEVPGIIIGIPYKVGYSRISRCDVMTYDGVNITASVRNIAPFVRRPSNETTRMYTIQRNSHETT